MKTKFKEMFLTGKLFFLIILIFNFYNCRAQNYRNEEAYLNDFNKNELYVKQCIIEYSNSVIQQNDLARTDAVLNTLIFKLNNINSIVLKNDIGFNGDVSLRDAFIKLNNKTMILLKNKSLKLDDYKEQSQLSLSEIKNNFEIKERNLKDYYQELIDYEKTKKIFGLNNNIAIKTSNEKEILEYNALQNFIFYKTNVIDTKCLVAMKNIQNQEVADCVVLLSEIKNNSINTLDKNYGFKDTTLSKANNELLNLVINNTTFLLNYFKPLANAYANLQEAKTNSTISNEDYNILVRHFNAIKAIFYEKSNEIQISKASFLNHWYAANSSFLKNNLNFENIKSQNSQSVETKDHLKLAENEIKK